MWQHWLRPAWLIALLPIITILILLFKNWPGRNNWHKVCDPHLLPHLISHKHKKKYLGPWILLSLGWLIAILALAGPSWTQTNLPLFKNQTGRVIILDLSTAMLTTDIPPSRITRARYKIIDYLQQQYQGHTGIIAFAGEAYVVAPLTEDVRTLLHLIPELSPEIMPTAGHSLNAALLKAQQLLQQANITHGNIIVVSAGPVATNALNTATKLQQQGYNTSVLAIGTEQGAPMQTAAGELIKDQHGNIIINKLDKSGLHKLAAAGKGRYVNFSNNDHDIKQLIFTQQQQMQQQQQSKLNTKQDNGRWLIFLLLPLAALAFRRGWLSTM